MCRTNIKKLVTRMLADSRFADEAVRRAVIRLSVKRALQAKQPSKRTKPP